METLYFRDFSRGVITHLPPTKLVDAVSPRAYNTAFRSAEGGNLMVGPRPGWREIAATGAGDTIPITGQGFFEYEEAGVVTTHHLAVAENGTLWDLTSGVAVALPLPTGTREFASATLEGAENGCLFVQARNRLFGFCINGTAFKVYRLPANTTLYVATIGIPTPDAVTYSGTAAGDLAGTIDVRVAWYVSATDTESSPSPVLSRSAANEALTFLLPTGAPSQVDKVRVYIRKQELQSKFYRSAALELPITDASVVLDFTDAELNQMTLTPAPTEQGYDPPPSRIRSACWHIGRLFVTDGVTLYYSQAGYPEQFDPNAIEMINSGDGQLLMALIELSEDTLGCFKERSIFGMSGQTPATWAIDQLADLGTSSTRSVAKGDGLIGFWSERGPCAWTPGGGPPEVLTAETLSPLVRTGAIRLSKRDACLGVFDSLGRRFLWTLDRTDGSDFTVIPWSTKHRCWEAIAWDLGALTSLTEGPSSSFEPRVFFSGPQSTACELSSGLRRDGATEDALTAYATVVSGTVAGLVLSTEPSVNARRSVARLISGRTGAVHRSLYTRVGTTLTWTTPSPFLPDAGDVVLFDGPVSEWDTIDTTFGSPSTEKRLLQSYAELWTSGDTPFLLALIRNTDRVPCRVWSTTVQANNRGLDVDGPLLPGAVRTHKRWAGTRAQWARFRFLGWYPLTDWGLVLIGCSYVGHDDED